MTFGLWGWAVGRVGLAASIIAAITLGIIVDDTVHFISKYLRARRERGDDALQATRYAYHTVGRALVITSLTLIVGFGVLAFSGFTINADTGILTAITIALALVVDLIYLPPLFMWADDRRNNLALEGK